MILKTPSTLNLFKTLIYITTPPYSESMSRIGRFAHFLKNLLNTSLTKDTTANSHQDQISVISTLQSRYTPTTKTPKNPHKTRKTIRTLLYFDDFPHFRPTCLNLNPTPQPHTITKQHVYLTFLPIKIKLAAALPPILSSSFVVYKHKKHSLTLTQPLTTY